MTRTLVIHINAFNKTIEGGYWAAFNAGQYHQKISGYLTRSEIGAAIAAESVPCVFLHT